MTDSRLKVGTAPRLPQNPVRAVHVSADAWAHPGLRAGVLRLARARSGINAVELDIKDELGIVGWRSGVRLARRIGAERDTYDLGAAVKLLHERGARVIERLVAFRDPVLAEWAWTHGRRELVVQTPSGSAYSGGYGGFTNYDHRRRPGVQRRSRRRGGKARRRRRPLRLRAPAGRPLESMVVPGLDGRSSRRGRAFLVRARQRLIRYDTFLGASVFGIAATRPAEIAQDVPAIAREVDYVAPMLYPSHWGPQEYGVAEPGARAVRDRPPVAARLPALVRGSGARVVPWLQDFSLGVRYGVREVRAQIDATRAAGDRRVPALGSRGSRTRAGRSTPNAAAAAAGSRASAPGSERAREAAAGPLARRSRAQRPRAERARRRAGAHVPPAAPGRRR